MKRCAWAPAGDPLYVAYHDEEWGVPSHDDRHLYEMLVLEGAQAGLSWSTILHKREGYRRAFAGFEPEAVARFGQADTERLLQDSGIVRNRLKVESAISNARCVLEVQEAEGSLAAYLWSFVGGRPIVGKFRELGDHSDGDGRVAGDEQGPQAARLSLRRADRLLRVHAVDGHGQRPRHVVLPYREELEG